MPSPDQQNDYDAMAASLGGAPADVDYDALAAEVSGGKVEKRTWTDTAVDSLPMIGGIAGGLAGAGLGPLAIGTAAIGGAGGEAWRQNINRLRGKKAPASPSEAAGRIATAGRDQGAAEGFGMGLGGAAKLGGKGVMRLAMGAQSGVRNKFPTVNLENVALREGVGLPGANIRKKASDAHSAVPASGRAADAAGAAPVAAHELLPGLGKLTRRAKQTRQFDDVARISEQAKNALRDYGGGLSREDTLAIKSTLATKGRQVMQGAADPRTAGIDNKIFGSMSHDAGVAATRGQPEITEALTRSQEMMALEKALKGMSGVSGLRTIATGAAGVGSGVASGDLGSGIQGATGAYMMTSPQGLSLLAQLLSKLAPGVAQAPRGLMELLKSHKDEQ